MVNLSGVGTPITYREDNEVLAPVEAWRAERWKTVREPETAQERQILADWLGHRGREEVLGIVGTGAYALSHFEMDMEWRHLISDHIAEECGHGWNFMRFADRLDPSKDHRLPDPEFTGRFGIEPRLAHEQLVRRDFLSYLIAGNLWIYGHVTASVRRLGINVPEVGHWQRTEQGVGEREHHYYALQKIHDTVWELIGRYGETAVRRRIAEIDAQALNARSRTLWDPPTRDFLVRHLGCSLEMAPYFMAWREYLYLNVLGFPPEPVTIREWPQGVPLFT